jgi:hypothetical protein
VPTSGKEGTISMTSAAAPDTAGQNVFGGVDSHADTLHVAVISDNGGHLADAEFTTTAAGYAAALAFLNAHGHVIAIGVEGTSSYGAGFTRAAISHGQRVVEVNRPDRAERRRIGKSDPIDAYAAARAALSGRASSTPKDDTVAGIRALHNAARSARPLDGPARRIREFGQRLTDWISCTTTSWVAPKVPSGRRPPAPPVPVHSIFQVTVAWSGYVPSPEERRYFTPQGGVRSALPLA